MTTWPTVQLRQIARLAYGDSLAADVRTDGEIPVFGSNGPVGSHDSANTLGPALVIGRKGSYGKVNYSHRPAFAIDTTYFVDARSCRHNLRWLYYAIGAVGLDSLSQDVGVPGLSRDAAYSQRIVLPPAPEQQAIADFLDTETARIDALITKKRRVAGLLAERGATALEDAFASRSIDIAATIEPTALREIELPDGWRVMKLSSGLRQLTNGYVGPTRDILQDAGVRYVQGLHLKRGLIDFDRRPYYVSEEWHRARTRTSLRPGDVLIVQTGDIGQAVVVPDDFGDANCHALLIARVEPSVLTGPYLAAYLQSRVGYHSLLRVATGALHPHLEFGIRDVPIVVPPLAVQEVLVEELGGQRSHQRRAERLLTRQIDLLVEHRQALITAAVTGELEIPGVAA